MKRFDRVTWRSKQGATLYGRVDSTNERLVIVVAMGTGSIHRLRLENVALVHGDISLEAIAQHNTRVAELADEDRRALARMRKRRKERARDIDQNGPWDCYHYLERGI